MKFFNTFVVSIAIILAASTTIQAEPTNSASGGNNANAAWSELQQVAILPVPPSEWETNPPTDAQAEKFHKQEGTVATLAAVKARDFYTRFPADTNAIAAMKLECQMLRTAYYDGDKTKLLDWVVAQKSMLTDHQLTDDDRFNLRVEMVRSQASALAEQQKSGNRLEDWNIYDTEYEKGVRELIKDYPEKDKPYEMLATIAATSPDQKALSMANEIMAFPISENVKIKTEGILRRLGSVGKLLDIKFITLDGRQVDLSQMKGKVVLVDFWATRCNPCVREMPDVKTAYEKFHSQGLEIIGISFDSNEQALQRFIQKNEMPWPQYFDGLTWKNKFGVQYGINEIPTMWLIDKKGNLRETKAGDNLEDKVEKLLAE